ncbi:hypothetical protein BDZ85DRAFT_257345 [Elsinoe ampelina]|uniref:Uncharacterized protein n=1 Tax=Elsinoe ampelina TaxID=302913 RepID=A0A6A6GN77_9PEZI|nr:hypothetical protein BDZ85DRAFT_257345 [Elsinoe ampelina]
MAQPTYLLAPNFTLHPGGSLALGSIIEDPFRPTQVRSKLTSQPKIVTHTETETSSSRSGGKSFHSSIFAQFLATATANLSGDVSKTTSDKYEMESLETSYFDPEITNEEATALVRDDAKVRASINGGRFGRRPVYVVSGLKVAKAFRYNIEVSTSKGGAVGGSVPIVEGVGMGAEVGGSRDKVSSRAGATAQDIIFAYQLHKIEEKGFRERGRRAESAVFVHKAAFLGKDDEEQEDAFEASLPEVEEYREVADELDVEGVMSHVTEDSSGTIRLVSFRALDD